MGRWAIGPTLLQLHTPSGHLGHPPVDSTHRATNCQHRASSAGTAGVKSGIRNLNKCSCTAVEANTNLRNANLQWPRVEHESPLQAVNATVVQKKMTHCAHVRGQCAPVPAHARTHARMHTSAKKTSNLLQVSGLRATGIEFLTCRCSEVCNLFAMPPVYHLSERLEVPWMCRLGSRHQFLLSPLLAYLVWLLGASV